MVFDRESFPLATMGIRVPNRHRPFCILLALVPACPITVLGVELSYRVDLDAFSAIYWQDNGAAEDSAAFAQILVGAGLRWNDTPWSVESELRLLADSESYTAGSALFIDDNLKRPHIALGEAYLQYLGDRWEWRLGNQYFTDGEGEFYSLVNQINALDIIDLPTFRQLPSPALSASFFGDGGTFRGVFVPFFTPSRLPQPGDRWFPDLANTFPIALPPLVPRELPSRDLEHAQGGLQWKSSDLLPNTDISLQVFYGIDTVGVYSYSPISPAPGLSRVFPRYTEWSGTFNTALERYSIYGELSFHDTEDRAADDDYVETLVGLNIDLTDLSPVYLDDLRLFFEYAGETTARHANRTGPYPRYLPTQQFVRPLQNTLIVGLRAEEFLRKTADAGLVYNLDDGDWFLQLGGRFRTRAGVWIGLQLVLLDGEADAFFGRWRRNDRFSASIQFDY